VGVGASTTGIDETRRANIWSNAGRRDVSLMLAHSLQERGIAEINVLPAVTDRFGFTMPRGVAIFLSPEARGIFQAIYDSPEMRVLQRTIEPGSSAYEGPDFKAVTMPVFQAKALQNRLMAMRCDDQAKYLQEAARAAGRSGFIYSRNIESALIQRDAWLNFNEGGSKLPARHEIRRLVRAVVETKLPHW
jgi:hypothetical protein